MTDRSDDVESGGADERGNPDADVADAFVADVADGVCRFRRPAGETRFLSTGFDGGGRLADAAYNVTVPDGWDDEGQRDLAPYAADRISTAGFGPPDDRAADAPVLLTGVAQVHARIARLDGVAVVATAGVSNPTTLPVPRLDATAEVVDAVGTIDDGDDRVVEDELGTDDRPRPGTVNLLVGSDRSLAPGALANLVAVAAGAKTATLLATTGFTGTTSDAVVVGCDPDGDSAAFSGAATDVGGATRACVRDAVLASLASRYGEDDGVSVPGSVGEAEHGVVTDRRADVSPVGTGR